MDLKPLAAGLGVTSLVAGLLALAGRVDASLLAAIVALLIARAAAAVVAADPAGIARIAETAPALVLFAVVAGVRAGSPSLDAIVGANAVAGPAITSGPGLLVAGMIVASVAALMALASAAPRMEGLAGRIEALALVGSAAALVAGTVGPQVEGWEEMLWWTVGTVVVLAVVAVFPATYRVPRLRGGATLLAIIGAALVVSGGTL
ncbi:MAG: hypothetical protein ACLGH3_07955 [Actinomycetota bacterium]